MPTTNARASGASERWWRNHKRRVRDHHYGAVISRADVYDLANVDRVSERQCPGDVGRGHIAIAQARDHVKSLGFTFGRSVVVWRLSTVRCCT